MNRQKKRSTHLQWLIPTFALLGSSYLGWSSPVRASLVNSNTLNTIGSSTGISGNAGACICSDGRPGQLSGQRPEQQAGQSYDFESSSNPDSVGGVLGGDAGVDSPLATRESDTSPFLDRVCNCGSYPSTAEFGGELFDTPPVGEAAGSAVQSEPNACVQPDSGF